jgi:CSLREA domain-containing protein
LRDVNRSETSRARTNRNLSGAMLAFVCALVAFAAIPAFAAAAGIEVDSLGDAPQEVPSATCDTGEPAGEECTLRAAIEAANFESDPSLIEFPTSIFGGGQQIEPTIALPAITAPVTISGSPVPYGAYFGPSVGVTAPAGTAGLTVEASGVTIEDVAFGGGDVGIEVLEDATGFLAKGNWFGLKVIGTPAPIFNAGILLGAGSEGASIGDGTAGSRNVFNNSGAGILVEGSSGNTIQGNYIGLGPAGTATAGVFEGVSIFDVGAAHSEDNLIGGTLTEPEAASAACDGPCNAVAVLGEGMAINLSGREAGAGAKPPIGPTTISGNYLGLSADGDAKLGEAEYDVRAGTPTGLAGPGPATVTLGGPLAPGGAYSPHQNVIDGGKTSVRVDHAEDFLAEGNAIGLLPGLGESDDSGPEENAFLLETHEGISDRPEIIDNDINLPPGETFGVASIFEGSRIIGNVIVGGRTGILTEPEAEEGGGNLIQGNAITGVAREAIQVENDSNTVIGNAIAKAGWVGIGLGGHSKGNRVGGDAPGEANTIVESGLRGTPEDGAITMNTRAGLRNEFAANTGFSNPWSLHQAVHQPDRKIDRQRDRATGSRHRAAVERDRQRGGGFDRPPLHQDEGRSG